MRFLALIYFLQWNFFLLQGIDFKCDPNRSCGCGRAEVEMNMRIINGEEAIPYSWSMIVSIRFDFLQNENMFYHVCAGTVVTENFILTSANCLERVIENIEQANVTIAAGIHRRAQPRQIIRSVDHAFVHPNWTGSTWNSDYDIALLHLSEPLDISMNPLITRTCISSQLNDRNELINYPVVNSTLVVPGWGRTNPVGDNSDALRQMMIAAIDPTNAKCVQITPDPIRQFCAGVYKDSIGPCYGDFGGPIFQWMNDHWEQVGIASATQDGCLRTAVISYTRLAYYRNWIDETLKNANDTIEEIPATVTIPTSTSTRKPIRRFECDRNLVACGCGRRDVQLSTSDTTLTESIPHSWSTIVSIRLNNQNKHSCTGTILSESFVLTSASCLINASSFGIHILAGIFNSSDEKAIRRKVDRVYFHPQSDYSNLHDLAILHLTEELSFENNLFLNRICPPARFPALPDPIHYPMPGAQLVVVGWGRLDCLNRTEGDLLQQMEVIAVDSSEKDCYVLKQNRHIQFCAGLNQSLHGTCVRDPGSPIFEWLNNHWQQVGITTFSGIDCKLFEKQGIYTRLIEYNDWIHSVTGAFLTTASPSTILPLTTTAQGIWTTTTTMRKSDKIPEVYRCNYSSTCGCGSVPVVLSPSRIVGGENAVAYSWPMMVAIHYMGNHYWCGGTVLSKSYVLTAAHCVAANRSIIYQGLSITVGSSDRTDSRRIQRTVDRVYVHGNFSNVERDRNHDIAVLHLAEPLTFENKLLVTKTCIHPLPASISYEKSIENGSKLTVIGWGKLHSMAIDLPTDLQQVEVLAIDSREDVCNNSIHDKTTQFCAGLPEGGKDACGGDSGGPILKWTGEYWEQIGIVSYGHGCADPRNPGVYTRISYYYDWINSILTNNSEHTEPQSFADQTLTNPSVATTTWTNSPVVTTTSSMRTVLNSTQTIGNNSSSSVKNNSSKKYSYTFVFFLSFYLFKNIFFSF